MCGIAGLVSLKDGQDITEKIKAMLAVIPHRGPDGEGVLSMRTLRLAIAGLPLSI